MRKRSSPIYHSKGPERTARNVPSSSRTNEPAESAPVKTRRAQAAGPSRRPIDSGWSCSMHEPDATQNIPLRAAYQHTHQLRTFINDAVAMREQAYSLYRNLDTFLTATGANVGALRGNLR